MKNWILWLVAGIFAIIGGILALFNPFAATLTTELLVAWIFIISGTVGAFTAWREEGWGTKIVAFFISLLALALGLFLLTNPIAGAGALTMVAASFLMVAGIFKVVLFFSARKLDNFWIVLVSGLVSIVLSIMIFSNFPQSAAVVLGIFLAVELISSGIMMIVISMASKDAFRSV